MEISFLEDMERNAKGFDQHVLAQAVEVMEFSEGQDAASFLADLMKETA